MRQLVPLIAYAYQEKGSKLLTPGPLQAKRSTQKICVENSL